MDAFLALRQRFAVLDRMIRDEGVKHRYLLGSRAQGFRIVQDVFFVHCALELANIAMDTDKRAPSVGQLIEMLDDEELRSSLREECASYKLPPGEHDDEIREHIEKLEREEQTKRSDQFDATWTKVQADWERFRLADWSTGFKKLRDKHAAHRELEFAEGQYRFIDLGKLGLKWGDLRVAVELLEELVLGLMALVLCADFQIESARKQFDKAAGDFWE